MTQTAGIAGKLSHSEVVPDIRNEDDGLGNQADVAAGDSHADDVLAGDTDSQTVWVILSLMMLVGKSRLYSLLVESFILDTLLKKCLV